MPPDRTSPLVDPFAPLNEVLAELNALHPIIRLILYKNIKPFRGSALARPVVHDAGNTPSSLVVDVNTFLPILLFPSVIFQAIC